MFAQISRCWSKAFVFALGVGMLCMMFSSTASAQQGWDKRTRVTFNAPVEIPGISAQVLPAGTYVFRLNGSASDRHIVQILNEDETHLFANVIAIPNYRLRPTDRTVMTFSERRAGEPQAIRAWFYPGDNFGQEFVYPKKVAVELAKVANVPVLYIPEEVAPNIVAPAPTPTAPTVIALKEAPVAAVTPAGADIAVAQVVEPPPVQTAAVLPKTASSLPFVALIGLFCLGVGLWLRPLCVR
jgi:hypothetical protein